MGVDDRFPPIEFFVDRIVRRIAKPDVAVAREHHHAIRLELIHAVLDFGEAALDIR